MKEHFSEVLNQTIEGTEDLLEIPEEMPEYEIEDEITTKEPTKEEIKKALREQNIGKAAGIDNIPPEILKEDMEMTIEILQPLFAKIWKTKSIPEDWKRGLLVKIPKNGDITNCNNWRGITLLSVPSKVLSRIILN